MIEYPWYELIKSTDEITQGDILKNCPVPFIKEFSGAPYNEGSSVNAEIKYIDGIILTQACDLANSKVNDIILCSITSKTDFENIQIQLGKSKNSIDSNIDSIRKGQQYAYHIINNFKNDEFEQDFYIINFKEIFSIPTYLAKEIAQSNGKRLRLCPPYREHLSQAFARYFMRVGLPINIVIE